MLDQLDRAVFAQGETVFSRGDTGDCAYLIQQGSVEVIAVLGGRELRISIIGEGELFGEVALIDHQPRTATVRTLEQTVLVPIPRELVQELLAKSDPILRHLLLVVLDRFRKNQIGAISGAFAKFDEMEYNQRKMLKGEATQRLALAHSMTRALTRDDEFLLHYQPICDLATGKVAGFEALIRWMHPTEGIIPPMEFLWLAEQTGLIHQIGIWTLNRALQDWQQLRKCTDTEFPFISVNMSASQLVSATLVDDFQAIIERHQTDCRELKLELTETMMVEQPELATHILQRMVELGCSLSLDDYGTGYSGLNHLQNFPIGTLKIDRSFISPMLESTQSLQIVQSSIELAHSLNMHVVAEGVETEAVRSSLLQLGCEYGQGWLFGRPLPVQDHLAAVGT